MAQLIKQGNIFGRIGTGIGQGLAEQVPKEIENYRLRTGLKNLADKSDQGNLSPAQFLAQAAGTYGVTPQMVQSFSELAKQQQIRNAYKRGRTPGQEYQPQEVQASPNLQNVKFGQIADQMSNVNQQNKIQPQQQSVTIPSNQPRAQEAISNPPAASENPLSEKFIPPSPWSQARNEQAINEAFDRGLATTFPEAQAYANSQREIYERAPEEYRKQLDYKKGIDQEVDNLFDKQLQARLQKEGKDTFADIPGDLQLNIKKKARNSVATGKMTPEQAAEYYSKKSLDLVKAKGRAKEIANRDILDRITPKKKEESLKNLMHIGKIYEDLGSSEDYYNFLRNDQNDPKTGAQLGMGLSPGGAAIIAYPRSAVVKSYINNAKISPKSSVLPSENIKNIKSTKAFAEGLLERMTPQDSFLAIARQMKQQYPDFDEYAFFDYLRENEDKYGSNPRLNLEVSQGVSDFFPNWRDIGLFPAFGKAVTND